MVKRSDRDDLNRTSNIEEPDANRDPITGTPGSHPVGAGLGAAGAGAAGAVIGGVVGGPVGAAAGAVVGGIAGGLGGKAAAEAVNPTVEDEYWREHYISRSYVDRHARYEDYQPAYRYGWESYSRYAGDDSRFDDVEPELGRQWERTRGTCPLRWEQAQAATRDAWERVEQSTADKSEQPAER